MGVLPISAAVSIYSYRHTPSGQYRVYWVTQLRTDDVVHCRHVTRFDLGILISLIVTSIIGTTFDRSSLANSLFGIVIVLKLQGQNIVGMVITYLAEYGSTG